MKRMLLAWVATVGLAIALPASAYVPAPVTWDLFDINSGSVVVMDSGCVMGSYSGNMLGDVTGYLEPENTLFADSYLSGYTHFVEWVTNRTVTVGGINLFAAHDAPSTQRAFDHFRLKAMVGTTMEVVYESDIQVPYQTVVENLVLSAKFTPVTSNRFRAEFIESADAATLGPRVIELDGFVPHPCGDADCNAAVNATDALIALKTAVGSASCPRCLCDADGSTDIKATDALYVLRYAVGQDVPMDCVSCLWPTDSTSTTTMEPTTTTTTTSTTTTTVPPPPAKLPCTDSRVDPPACDGYCGANGQMCVEYPPGSGACQCLGTGFMCGQEAGPPSCNGSCPMLFVCKYKDYVCQCVF